MKRIVLVSLLVLGCAAFAWAADEGSLVQSLAKQLNITDEQAAGGAGAIFSYAQTALPKDDYGKVASAVPEAADLIKKAPPTDTASSVAGSALGKAGGSAAGLAGLTSSFEKLGLKSDMVGKFTPIVVDYVQNKGGEEVGGIMRKVLTP